MATESCDNCGACCATFRVDFHPAELASRQAGGVPDVLQVDDEGRVVQRFVSSQLPLGILPSSEIVPHHDEFTWDAPC